MGEVSVQEQVRLAWAKKQKQIDMTEAEPEAPLLQSEKVFVSLLSDSEEEVLQPRRKKPKQEVPSLPDRQLSSVKLIDLTESPSIAHQGHIPPFKPLHNPTYDTTKLHNSVTIKDILGSAKLYKSFLFSFQYSLPFILESLHSKRIPLTLLYQRGTVIDYAWKAEYNLTMIEVEMPPFSSHHPKLIVNIYDGGAYMKLFMISANMTELEFALNNQIVWESPALPYDQDSPSTTFKERMIQWVKSYGKAELQYTLLKDLPNYDFSGIVGEFIASSSCETDTFGYFSLLSALAEKNLIPKEFSNKSQLLYQSSSVGAPYSCTKDGAGNIFTHILFPLVMGKKFPILNGNNSLRELQKQLNTDLYVVFPTLEDVQQSKFGYDSGGWSHYNPYSKNGSIQHTSILSRILHRSHSRQRGTNTSHTKFLLFSKDGFKSLEWVLFTSANMSKSAWGTPPKKDTGKIKIANYETGILISRFDYSRKGDIKLIPVTIGENKLLRDNEIPVVLPFELPPKKYSQTDAPWCTSKNYGVPDSRGIKQQRAG